MFISLKTRTSFQVKQENVDFRPTKKLAAYCIFFHIWFVAKILAANGCPTICLTGSCQIIGQVWVENSLAKILASQFLSTFGKAR
jgi:hypothetical protein